MLLVAALMNLLSLGVILLGAIFCKKEKIQIIVTRIGVWILVVSIIPMALS